MKPGIAYETLLEVRGYVLGRHPFSIRPSIAVRDLADQNVVLLDLLVVSEYYASQFDQAGISPRIVATANSPEMVRSLVGNETGCSLLHMATGSAFTYAGDKVTAVPLHPPIEPFKTVLGHLPDNPRRLEKSSLMSCTPTSNIPTHID